MSSSVIALQSGLIRWIAPSIAVNPTRISMMPQDRVHASLTNRNLAPIASPTCTLPMRAPSPLPSRQAAAPRRRWQSALRVEELVRVLDLDQLAAPDLDEAG